MRFRILLDRVGYCLGAFVLLGLSPLLSVWDGQHLNAQEPISFTIDNNGGVHATRSRKSPWPRLAAEFESSTSLVLSVGDWQPHHRLILQQIASKTRGHLSLVILCGDSIQMKETTRWLAETGEAFSHVYLGSMPTDTIWLRDFGPIFMQTAEQPNDFGQTEVLDFYYVGVRPKDDRLPAIWTRQTRARHVPVPWTLQGGNLMSNGDGLALTTTRIFEDNHIEFERSWPGQDAQREAKAIVIEAFAQACNLAQLIVLEPLQFEETRHVDMFASFLSPTDVLVAQLDPLHDPVNAAILERNVERLRRVKVPSTNRSDKEVPLTVHRIAIPPREDTSWSAYTNAIITNDLVLMPVFADESPTMIDRAVSTYQKLLPGHTIKTVDMTTMKQLQGELHCLSMHVPDFAPMPRLLYHYDDAYAYYFGDQPIRDAERQLKVIESLSDPEWMP
ncbi:agmatine deiminase family protein [Neorhodopirellula pilleata]|uniref:Putative agmatine deiminase n=1 Tax=Neorhodopirellula pilleata TaxID=2714738 RepID=A0A5C6AR23_9BACT|nr:agmatine deiminase family protein [Neorhodopirellula pilleata]TWU01669.1 putative agmatine deiminase [Neorhodopirellula pilleata]